MGQNGRPEAVLHVVLATFGKAYGNQFAGSQAKVVGDGLHRGFDGARFGSARLVEVVGRIPLLNRGQLININHRHNQQRWSASSAGQGDHVACEYLIISCSSPDMMWRGG